MLINVGNGDQSEIPRVLQGRQKTVKREKQMQERPQVCLQLGFVFCFLFFVVVVRWQEKRW